MAITVTWLGHACWQIDTGQHSLLVDPYLDDCPTATVKSDQVETDFILVTHGHFDHLGDTVKIAARTRARVIAAVEVCQAIEKEGIKKYQDMNLGGNAKLPFGQVKMTVAQHSSSLNDGGYAGNPAGFLLRLDGATIYIAGDTALTMDMQLLARYQIDLAILPIGDLYTMGIEDSIEAIKFVQPKRVAPSHYDTWPPIKQDVNAWAQLVREQTKAEPVVLKPGGVISL